MRKGGVGDAFKVQLRVDPYSFTRVFYVLAVLRSWLGIFSLTVGCRL
jgi:hypothetical protein